MATETPDIRIPTELKPLDGRFGSGPSKVRGEAIDALAQVGARYLGTSHRREGVRSEVRRIREGLRELFSLPDGYEVVLGLGGATLFWDAIAAGLVRRRSQHVVFGEFSSKCAKAVEAAPHLEVPEVIETEPGTHPDPKPNPDVDLYALTQNETSTGVSAPVRRPGPDGLVCVDAVSAAGGLRVDPSSFDVYYFSPQKVFAADAGLWVALCSPAAIERIEKLAADGDRWIPDGLNLATAVANSRKDQTYNTPPLASVFLMRDTVDWIVGSGGLEWSASRCDRNAEVIYGWAERTSYARPFVAKPEERSHTVATIDFTDEVEAAIVASVLRANGIVDVEPYRKLGRNQLRIALFPAIETDDLERLTRSIDHVVERLP